MSRQQQKLRRRLRGFTDRRSPGTYETIRQLAISGGPEAVLAMYPMLDLRMLEVLTKGWRATHARFQAKNSTPSPQ